MNSPYERWTTDPLWETVSAAVSDLVENVDLKEQTAHDYIVGYIVMKIRSALDQVRSE
jgi:hypothetical protein